MPVPDLQGDVLATVDLLHQVLAVLADWERSDPDRAANPESALPDPLGGGVAAAALATIGDACEAALTDAAQPSLPPPAVSSTPSAGLTSPSRTSSRSASPPNSPAGPSSPTAPPGPRKRSPPCRRRRPQPRGDRHGRRFGSTAPSPSSATTPSTTSPAAFPAGAGPVALDRTGHIAYSRYATAIHDIWFDDLAPYTTLEFHHPTRTTGSPWGARPPRPTPSGEQPG